MSGFTLRQKTPVIYSHVLSSTKSLVLKCDKPNKLQSSSRKMWCEGAEIINWKAGTSTSSFLQHKVPRLPVKGARTNWCKHSRNYTKLHTYRTQLTTGNPPQHSLHHAWRAKYLPTQYELCYTSLDLITTAPPPEKRSTYHHLHFPRCKNMIYICFPSLEFIWGYKRGGNYALRKGVRW